MKEQTSETISSPREVVIECSIDQQERNSNKIAKCQEDKTNNNDNHDAGYMTSSSDSLHADVEDAEEAIDDKWKLSVPPKLRNFSDDEFARIFRAAEIEMEKVPEGERREWLLRRFSEYYDSVLPRSLIELTVSHLFNGDSGNSVDVKPDWLDMEKFRRGQKLAQDHIFGIYYANLLSLFTVFSFEDGLKPLILTDASSTPYTAFKRYLSTGQRLQNWYRSDPWTKGTAAYNDIRAVCRIHAMVRKKIQETPDDVYNEKTTIKAAWCPALSRTRRDMESTCPAPKPGQCPYVAVANFPELKQHKLSQGEMAATQFAFLGLAILHPKFFGLHGVTDDDLEAYCHLWRGIGYLLGIEDDFNFCRGTLEDVRARSRDFLNYWVKPNFRVASPEWEHMMRCTIEGLQYYFPGVTYETCLLDLAEVMDLHMPRTYNDMSYSHWIRYSVVRFYYNHGSKWTVFREFMNRQLNAAVEKAQNYDERKHQELKERSAKTMDSYFTKLKTNEIPSEQNSQSD